MFDEFSIIGCGARTPLGLNRRSSAAAVRAGIAALAEHPSLVDRFGEPMTVTRDAVLDADLALPERLLALAVNAASEALAPLKGLARASRVAIAVSFGEERPGLSRHAAAMISRALGDALQGPTEIEQVLHWMGGHAGGIMAMENARRLIEEGRAEIVLVGGVDSYLSRDSLEWLDDNEQLHSDENIYGFCPGEAAGFVLIARTETALRLNLMPLVTLVSVASGFEKNLIKTESICLGEGLAATLRGVAQSLHKGEAIDRIICDMNGERYRGNEYGFATLKTPGLCKNPAAFEAPADCWGDVGAASGPLYVSLVVEAEARGYSKGPLSLIWASSEGGRRAAAILRRWGSA